MSIKGSPQKGLFAATLGFFFGFAAVALFGTTAQDFNGVMHMTPIMIGLLVAMPSLSGSLLRIPFAAWVDITGGRKPFLVLLGLSLVGMAGLTVVIYSLYPAHMSVQLYPLLLLLGVLSGCGIATFSVGISQVSYWFPKSKQGSALGVYAGFGNIAPGIFTLLLPFALLALGLGGSYLVWLLLLAAGTVLYALLGLNSPFFQYLSQGMPRTEARAAAERLGQEMFPQGNLVDSLRQSIKIWQTWALVAVYFTTFGGFMALTAWLPTYWKSFLSEGAITAGLLTALFTILASLARVAGGWVADRLGGENTALMALGVFLAGAALMFFSHTLALSLIGEILMACGMGVANAAVFKMVPQDVPQAVGGASGWVGGLGAFGGFVLPPLLGAIVHLDGAHGYGDGFVIFIALGLVSLGLAYLLKRRRQAAIAMQDYVAREPVQRSVPHRQ